MRKPLLFETINELRKSKRSVVLLRRQLKSILSRKHNLYLFQGIKTDLSDEYRLHNYLNDGYNPIVRPVIKPETKIELKFDVALQQLIGVVSKYLKKKDL